MNFSRIMTRRELLLLGKRLLLFIAGWRFLPWPRSAHSMENFHSQLADIIGYLLYENNPPSNLPEKIGQQVKAIISSALAEKLKQEIIFETNIKNFKDLLPEDKKIAVKTILPELVQHLEIIDIINNSLQGGRAFQYLGYPDLPGVFGECGWLVLEGDVWDRYYPPSS